jgi:hypothetical protein
LNITDIKGAVYMGQVVEFAKRLTNKPQKSSQEGYSFTDEVNKDTKKLADSLDITMDEAILVAADFYKRYPMLIEWVRSPGYMLRN